MRPAPASPRLTAECNGRFAGYANVGPWRTREACPWTPEVGIDIEADFRGRGVGAVRQPGHEFGHRLDVGSWQLMLRDGGHQPVPSFS